MEDKKAQDIRIIDLKMDPLKVTEEPNICNRGGQTTIEKGNIGIKSGKGIYDFSAINIEEYKEEKLSNFGELLKHLGLLPKSA